MQDIMFVRYCIILWLLYVKTHYRGCKVSHASSGGVTHWLITPDDDGTPMTVTWGQNAANGRKRVTYSPDVSDPPFCLLGELGLGPEEPKSATKPTRSLPLVGIHVFEHVPLRFLCYPLVLITTCSVLQLAKTLHYFWQNQMQSSLIFHAIRLM
jgi:hypothetical protein